MKNIFLFKKKYEKKINSLFLLFIFIFTLFSYGFYYRPRAYYYGFPAFHHLSCYTYCNYEPYYRPYYRPYVYYDWFNGWSRTNLRNYYGSGYYWYWW